MPRPSRKTLLASALAALWLASMLAAYWWFENRYLRSFDERAALFSGAALRLPEPLAGPGPIRLVHFWDPACPCNVGNQQHLAELVEHFAPRGVAFYAVQKPGSHGQLPASLGALRTLTQLRGAERIPASPAVAIWDRQGELAYFGPYSEGLTCNSSNSFIEPILEALAAGRAVNASNTLAVGCFCEWSSPTPD
ncbi:thiol-disulfide isomerase [Pseudomonas sp. CrR25]|nr:thiol-disulfide isomerase [Pseudomonas sp. CrR25]